jgi:hypothetical protein
MTAFEGTYAALRALMLHAAPRMRVAKDDGRELHLHATWNSPAKPSAPMWFGAVRSEKAYVSYHLMPLYTDGALKADIPPELAQRMQGKTCFNFTRPDPELFRALGTLTRRCAIAYARPPTSPFIELWKKANAAKSARRKRPARRGEAGGVFPPAASPERAPSYPN